MFLNINAESFTIKIYKAMAAPVPKKRLYPSLDEVSGKRKHSNGKENLPVTPLAKRAKLLQGTPVRVRSIH